jgi:hypothetical protein
MCLPFFVPDYGIINSSFNRGGGDNVFFISLRFARPSYARGTVPCTSVVPIILLARVVLSSVTFPFSQDDKVSVLLYKYLFYMKMGKDFSLPICFVPLARFFVSDPRGTTFSRAARD